ncbi:MAG: CopG family antitoxin [Gammaproteobacteria bacterium]
MKKIILDAYEQEIEDNFEKFTDPKNKKELMQEIVSAAKNHVKNKKPITLRVSANDIEIIKLKASKLGLPYQTYINMLIHKDAIQL